MPPQIARPDEHTFTHSGTRTCCCWPITTAGPISWILISHHADGQLITEITGKLGFRAVRGSSTRGGVKAVRGIVGAEAWAKATTWRSLPTAREAPGEKCSPA